MVLYILIFYVRETDRTFKLSCYQNHCLIYGLIYFVRGQDVKICSGCGLTSARNVRKGRSNNQRIILK
jgi:hypothetical protein